MLGFASSPQPTALNHLAQGVMDDAVAKRRGTDLATLRLVNEDELRLYLRLARQWDWLSSGQYEHVSRLVAQVGRLLGGWIRQTASGRSARSGREAEDFS